MDSSHPVASRVRSTAGFDASLWLHRLVVVLAIAVCWLGDQAQRDVAALPEHVDVGAWNHPVAIDGVSVHGAEELHTRLLGAEIGQRVTLTETRGERRSVVELERAHSSVHTWLTRLNGLLFLAVSLVVFAPRVDRVPARDLFWACLLYGVAVMIGGIHPPAPAPTGTIGPQVLLPLARILSLVILPVLMLHVGLTFPRRSRLLDRAPWLFPTIVAVGLAIGAWQGWAWIRWFGDDDPGAWSAIVPAREAGGLFLALVFAGGCLGLIRGARQTRSDREREQVKWVLWGIAMGAVPFVFLHALPGAIGLEPLLPIEGARVFSVVIPVAFSFAVIRHKFLDVDIIIRRSLLYVLLASMMVGIYALLGIFAGHRVEERWPETAPFVPIVATLVSALLFHPTRKGIARVIDRLFFKIRYDHAQALEGFRAELRRCSDQDELATLFARFLGRTLAPDRIAVELRHGDTRFTAGELLDSWPFRREIPAGSRVIALPGRTARADIESESFPSGWSAAGYVIAHRVHSEEQELGLVALGEKSSERSYVVEDLDLLASASREVGLRLHRLNLEQEVLEEVVARHRMEEMNRFRTQFFAQFAHDLRSPLTSISWSARNLLDGVVGPVSPPQREYLDGIESSARQLVRLVNNLLEVTRLESGLPEIELGPVDLREVAEESIGKLRATAGAKDVEIEIRSRTDRSALAHREKLLEIVDNLVENAIRYAPPSSTINVTIEAVDGTLRLAVEDHGPGLDPEEIDVIFEPYRQGRPSPHSNQQGFGLGLFVVRSWIERMGGEVLAANREAGGAHFEFRLPLAPASPPADEEN